MDSKKPRSSIRRTAVVQKDEDSTESKTNRRISFSGKKFVRIFNGDVEPKNWDKSYEVSDHTNEDSTEVSPTQNKKKEIIAKTFTNKGVLMHNNKENEPIDELVKNFRDLLDENSSLVIESSINFTLLPQENNRHRKKKNDQHSSKSGESNISFLSESEKHEIRISKNIIAAFDKTEDFMNDLSKLNDNFSIKQDEVKEEKNLTSNVSFAKNVPKSSRKTINETHEMSLVLEAENISQKLAEVYPKKPLTEEQISGIDITEDIINDHGLSFENNIKRGEKRNCETIFFNEDLITNTNNNAPTDNEPLRWDANQLISDEISMKRNVVKSDITTLNADNNVNLVESSMINIDIENTNIFQDSPSKTKGEVKETKGNKLNVVEENKNKNRKVLESKVLNNKMDTMCDQSSNMFFNDYIQLFQINDKLDEDIKQSLYSSGHSSNLSVASPFSSPLIPPGYVSGKKTKINFRQLNDAIEHGQIQIYPGDIKTPTKDKKCNRKPYWFIDNETMDISDKQVIPWSKLNNDNNFSEETKNQTPNIEATTSLHTRNRKDQQFRYSQADEFMLDNTNFLTKAKLGDESHSQNNLKYSELQENCKQYVLNISVCNNTEQNSVYLTSKFRLNAEDKNAQTLYFKDKSLQAEDSENTFQTRTPKKNSCKSLYFDNCEIETSMFEPNCSLIEKNEKTTLDRDSSECEETRMKSVANETITPLRNRSQHLNILKMTQFTPGYSMIEFEDLENECKDFQNSNNVHNLDSGSNNKIDEVLNDKIEITESILPLPYSNDKLTTIFINNDMEIDDNENFKGGVLNNEREKKKLMQTAYENTQLDIEQENATGLLQLESENNNDKENIMQTFTNRIQMEQQCQHNTFRKKMNDDETFGNISEMPNSNFNNKLSNLKEGVFTNEENINIETDVLTTKQYNKLNACLDPNLSTDTEKQIAQGLSFSENCFGYKRLSINLTPIVPSSKKKRQTIIFDNWKMDEESYPLDFDPETLENISMDIERKQTNNDKLECSTSPTNILNQQEISFADQSNQIPRSYSMRESKDNFLDCNVGNDNGFQNKLEQTCDSFEGITKSNATDHLLRDNKVHKSKKQSAELDDSTNIVIPELPQYNKNMDKNKNEFNESINITLFCTNVVDRSGIENTSMSLVETMIEDENANAHHESIAYGITHNALLMDREEHLKAANAPVGKKKCIRCAGSLNITESTNDSFVLPQLPSYVDSEITRLHSLRKKPNLIDIHEHWQRKFLDAPIRRNIEKLESEVKTIEQSHDIELLDTYRKNIKSYETRIQLEPVVIQDETFVSGFHKLLNKECPNWIFNHHFLSRDELIFYHRKIITLRIIIDIEKSDDFPMHINEKSFHFDFNRIVKKNWRPFHYLLYDQLQFKLAFNFKSAIKDTNDLTIIRTLKHIDECCVETRAIADELWILVNSMQAELIRDSTCNLIRKIQRKKMVKPNEGYTFVEKHEFLIEINNISSMSFRDILFPQIYLFDESIQFLPIGMQFLKVFLEDPMKYLK